MSLKETEEGRLAFFDQSGEMVYILGSLFAVDSAGRYTDQVIYEVQEQKDNVVTLSVTIAEEYVTDSGRQYPILIDPSIMLTGGDVTYDTLCMSCRISLVHRIIIVMQRTMAEYVRIHIAMIMFIIFRNLTA